MLLVGSERPDVADRRFLFIDPSILCSRGGKKKLRHNNISPCSLCLPLVAMATEFATAASWKRWTTNAESSLVRLCLLDRAKARDTLGDLGACYHVAFEDDGCRCLLSKHFYKIPSVTFDSSAVPACNVSSCVQAQQKLLQDLDSFPRLKVTHHKGGESTYLYINTHHILASAVTLAYKGAYIALCYLSQTCFTEAPVCQKIKHTLLHRKPQLTHAHTAHPNSSLPVNSLPLNSQRILGTFCAIPFLIFILFWLCWMNSSYLLEEFLKKYICLSSLKYLKMAKLRKTATFQAKKWPHLCWHQLMHSFMLKFYFGLLSTRWRYFLPFKASSKMSHFFCFLQGKW